MATDTLVAREHCFRAEETADQEFSVLTQPFRKKGHSVSMHSHLLFEIALICNGECEIRLDQTRRVLQRGYAYFVPAGLRHGFVCDSPQGVQFVVTYFRHLDDELVTRLTNASPIGVFSLSEAELTRFVEISHSLQYEISGTLPYAPLKAQALKLELVVLLLRAKVDAENGLPRKGQRELIQSALYWMQTHSHDESVTIGDVARRVGLSPSYFRMLFNQTIGNSPKQYLTLLRLQTSKSLMIQGEHTIANIAALSGFHSPQQFSRLFRQYTGVSPSEWRETRFIPGD